MAKRKILAIIIALVFCIPLGACSIEDQPEASPTSEMGTFIVVEEGNIKDNSLYQHIMYDPDTLVMYSYINGYENGGLTVLYNADGTVKTYCPNETK